MDNIYQTIIDNIKQKISLLDQQSMELVQKNSEISQFHQLIENILMKIDANQLSDEEINLLNQNKDFIRESNLRELNVLMHDFLVMQQFAGMKGPFVAELQMIDELKNNLKDKLVIIENKQSLHENQKLNEEKDNLQNLLAKITLEGINETLTNSELSYLNEKLSLSKEEILTCIRDNYLYKFHLLELDKNNQAVNLQQNKDALKKELRLAIDKYIKVVGDEQYASNCENTIGELMKDSYQCIEQILATQLLKDDNYQELSDKLQVLVSGLDRVIIPKYLPKLKSLDDVIQYKDLMDYVNLLEKLQKENEISKQNDKVRNLNLLTAKMARFNDLKADLTSIIESLPQDVNMENVCNRLMVFAHEEKGNYDNYLTCVQSNLGENSDYAEFVKYIENDKLKCPRNQILLANSLNTLNEYLDVIDDYLSRGVTIFKDPSTDSVLDQYFSEAEDVMNVFVNYANDIMINNDSEVKTNIPQYESGKTVILFLEDKDGKAIIEDEKNSQGSITNNDNLKKVLTILSNTPGSSKLYKNGHFSSFVRENRPNGKKGDNVTIKSDNHNDKYPFIRLKELRRSNLRLFGIRLDGHFNPDTLEKLKISPDKGIFLITDMGYTSMNEKSTFYHEKINNLNNNMDRVQEVLYLIEKENPTEEEIDKLYNLLNNSNDLYQIIQEDFRKEIK